MVTRCTDEYVREFFQTTYPQMPSGAALPIVTRLDAFLRPAAMRRVLRAPVSSFSLRKVLEDGLILFVDLWGLSGSTAEVLGGMVLAKLQLSLMQREKHGGTHEVRHLYVDEFQTIGGVDVATWQQLMSRGRKYGVGLTLAHQFPSQLPLALQKEIRNNVGSILAFGLGADDARIIRRDLLHRDQDGRDPKKLTAIPAEALIPLSKGAAYAKLARGRAVRVQCSPPLSVPSVKERTDNAIATSWRRFGHHEGDSAEVSPVEPTPHSDSAAPQSQTPEAPADQPLPGRGGARHRELQALIRGAAQQLGFKADLEAEVLGGTRRVDVALSRGDVHVALEIAVTSSVESAVAHLVSCVRADFTHVLFVSEDSKKCTQVKRSLAGELSSEDFDRIHCGSPDAAIAYLSTLPNSATQQTVAGWKVTVGATEHASQSVRSTLGRLFSKGLRKIGGQ